MRRYAWFLALCLAGITPALAQTGVQNNSGTGFFGGDETVSGSETVNGSQVADQFKMDSVNQDVILLREGAGIMAQRNLANAQLFRLYNTWSDASNNEVFQIGFSSNTALLTSRKNGTGTQRSLTMDAASILFQSGGTDRWTVNSSGHLLASTDGAVNIGAAGATRPGIAHLATAVVVGNTPAAAGNVRLPSGGTLRFRNSENTDDIMGLTTSANDLSVNGGYWHFTSAGHLTPNFDNTQDFGASGVRLRSGYFGTSAIISAISNQIVLGTTNTTTLTVPAPSSSRTITLGDPGGNDSVTYLAATQTLTNKTVSGATLSGTISGTPTWGSGQNFPANLQEAGNRVNTRNMTYIIPGSFFTGTVLGSTVYGRWTPDVAVTLKRINVSCLTAGSGQTTGTQFQVSDGATASTVTLINAVSGTSTFTQNYASGTVLLLQTGTTDGIAPQNCNIIASFIYQ